MKLRLPHRLIQALLATCAVTLSTTSVFADVPEGYTEVPITLPSQLNSYKNTDYCAFLIEADITNSSYRITGAHQYWSDELLGAHFLTFSDISSSSGGAISATGLTMEKLKGLEFSSCKCSSSNSSDGGGAIRGSVIITISRNETAEFSGNHAVKNGGAIFSPYVRLTENDALSFVDNYVSCSYTDSSNSSSTFGGAISGYNITLEDNKSVMFRGNTAASSGDYDLSSARGGAIWGGHGGVNNISINIISNDNVSFTGNHASSTGTDNGFAYGGAIGATDKLYIADNKSVQFSENYTLSKHSVASGGAIHGADDCVITIIGNDSVVFNENYSSSKAASASGGAIRGQNRSVIELIDNGSVEFRGNYEVSDAAYRLRSIYTSGIRLTLAASKDQNITFYDPVYAKCGGVSGTITVSFNAPYLDTNDKQQDAAGEIIFSGEFAKQDLAKLKEDYTQEELTNALTTEVYATSNLYGGRLRVEDGAIYKGNGISVAENSNATLRLAGGTLSHNGYNVTLASGTKLDLQGANSITAKTLDMMDGSIMSFTLGKDNLTTAAVTLTGTFKQGGALTISLADDGTMERENKYALLTIASGATPETWDITKLAIEGLDSMISDLSWSNGTLYFTYPLPELETATWSGGQSRVWNTTAMNWTQGKYSYAYKDGVDVVFGDTGSGSVTLDGTLAPKSVLVENTAGHDYTWEGSGKLTGNATLTKNGEGSLTVNTANDYTGGTVLNGGTLVAGKAKAFGSGSVHLNGGVLDLGGYTISNQISAENADIVIRNGTLRGGFSVTGGNIAADGLHIETQSISIAEATSVIFNSAAIFGAIRGEFGGTISLVDNGSVTFSSNKGDQGGALSGKVSLTKNDHLVFSGNTAAYGGAISGEGSITDNGSVEFIGNNATTEGGAIDSWDFVLSRNESVMFSGNTTNWDGGAIVNTGTLALSDNGSIEFRENFDGETGDGGGAIRTYGAINLTGNDKVAFSKNSTAGFGGAILAGEQDIAINISNNGSVEFSGNSSAYDGGGAIYFNDTATLNITGNDHVVFRGNYEQGGLEPFYNLRSVYMHNWIGQMEIDEYEYMQNPEYYDSFKSNLNLSAGKGQDIVFYDPMYVCSGTNVYFNAESGATGDIVFSGKYAAEDLKALKEDYRDWELTNSLTTEVYNTTYLCGGRMNVEDGAIYKGNGIEVGTWMGTDATLRLANGTLDQEGIGIYMNTGSTLALEGVNSITAPDLFMGRNCTLAVTLGSENAETALLTLYGDFVWSQQLRVDVSYDEAAAAAAPLRIFDTCREGVPTGWTEQNVSVSGTTFDKLQWSEGILYLNLTGGDIPLLPSLEWAGGDMRWNTTSANWLASGAPATYSENAKVHFGDAGAGTVMLSGTLTPRSVEVENTTGHDYTFQGGCLTGGMHLTKNGEGVLTVKSANDYMGGTVLNAGTLVAGSSEAFGTGAIQINGGTLDLGGHSIGNDITIAKGAGFAIRNGSLNCDLEIVGGSMVADGLHLETQNLSITNAGSVVFRNAVSELSPYSWDGGAISGADIFCSLDISNNGNLVFTGNSAGDYGNGGAIYVASEYGTINITGNGNVTFSGNTACSGGAIYAEAYSLNIANNDHVEFRGNYEIDTCQLRSIYSPYTACVSLSLTAGENQDIVFYDTLYVENGSYVELNNWDNANGDIVFSGKYAKEDLAAWKPNYTEQELTDSLTSELYTTTYLYGGRLRVEDGAILKGNGISVDTWTGSSPVIRLSEGTLDQTGYDITMNAGSTLDLERENHITASSLQLADDTVIHFMMGSGQQSAILSLDATLQTGSLLASVDGDYANEHVLITLADAAQYDISAWTPDKVTVRGTNFAHLVWNEGSLYYRPADIKDITLADDTESDDEIDEVMSSGEGVDIEGNGHKLTVKHPVDLVHLAMKDGVVRLEGDNNNVVRITLTEDGTLQLAAGAGLNVGNIVSMVANGSADLEISGDIEISDIKAYGKPGNKGTLSYVNMTTAGDYTIENMTITGSVIDVGEGTTLYLVNVDIKSDTHITDDPARVFAQSAHVELNGTNTWVDKEITAAQDTLLYMCGNTQRSITLAAGSEIVELTSSMFDTVTLTGTDLWLDMTGIAEATYGKDYFTLDFQDLARKMAKAQVDVENLHVYATLDGERYTEAYSTANGGLTTTLYFQVPEPATGTLSLLALAALAARRKRK